jgi:Domain of unknown function (DUF4136)
MAAMKHAIALCVLAGIAVLVGCTTVHVDSDYEPGTDFSALRRYAWLWPSQPPTGDPRIDNPLLDARLRGAIDAQLAQQGLVRVAVDAADFLVAYQVAVKNKTDVQTIYRSYGRASWGGVGSANTVVQEYDEGTLWIDFLRPDSGELLWRGSARTRLREQRTPEARYAYATKIIAQLLAQYPPQ